VVGAVAGVVVTGVDGAREGATAGRVFFGWALASFGWVFFATGAELVPTVGTVRLGVMVTFGEPLPPGAAFPQAAAITMIGRSAEDPTTMRVTLRLRSSR
jgi:hypothetical protein